MRKAKIVATIGPATESPVKLRQLIRAGVDVVRFNFSHGCHETYHRVIREVRRLSCKLGKPVAILQDLQGSKIRTGQLKNGGPVQLKAGRSLTITTRPIAGDHRAISTSYAALPSDVKAGDSILLSDGLIKLRVISTSSTEIRCGIVRGGDLAQNQGINIPGVVTSAPALTRKDLRDLEFGINQQVDYIALSFVRSAHDVLVLKRRLARKRSDIPVIAKLEKPQAIENLDQIMEVCEGVMIARGDLGVEMSPEKVPVIQKVIIREANRKRKLVITATQMLESMMAHPLPTRAEASDVANAVFDGSDAVMLSGETAKGNFPVESVKMMAKIICEAESLGLDFGHRATMTARGLSFPETICDAAYRASQTTSATAVIAFTQSGDTARLISKYRPATDIFAFTPHPRIASRMSLFWGTRPILMAEIHSVDDLIPAAERILLRHKLVRKNDNLIILTGAPLVERGHTSLMKLHRVKG